MGDLRSRKAAGSGDPRRAHRRGHERRSGQETCAEQGPEAPTAGLPALTVRATFWSFSGALPLRNILAKVDQIVDKAKRLGRPVERVNTVRSEIEQLQKQMLEQF